MSQKVLVRWSKMAFSSVYGEILRRSFLGSLYLNLWYSHASFVSYDWVGGSRLCGLVQSGVVVHSHCTFILGMVIKCLPTPL